MALSSSKLPVEIWRCLSEKFIGSEASKCVRAPTKEQIVALVKNNRSKEQGNDVYRKIEVPPFSSIADDDSRLFLQFHTINSIEGKLLRQIGWAHPELLSLLFHKSLALYLDGTFRCVPHPFSQCYILMAFDPCTDEYIPIFYVLLEAKTEWTYWTMLHNIICSTHLKIHAETITVDFECAAIQAINGNSKGLEQILPNR